ncbi:MULTISPECIES: hypothetical protein [Roseateles]|uniref:Uncharacterized protein n=1 Tax=Roseateles albus TaxID=2987525 RepID=A0ABT5KBC7_9BURK|nr:MULTISPECIES: hypothetical protein [Roseateles]MCV2358944.1 hypothetical protein [Paucibacter sp. TC2R-5]MDC8771188.1 hypothetical protein [Roseateles albus]
MIEATKLIKPQADPAPKWFHIAVAASMVLSTASAVYSSMRTSAAMQALVKENSRLVLASSTPLLQFMSSNFDGGQPALSFSVTNDGNGPARIVWFEMKSEGKLVKSLRAQVRESSPETAKLSVEIMTSTIAPRLISPGSTIKLFSWSQPAAKDAEALQLWRQFDRQGRGKITVEACYCSVLDACWISDLEGSIPKPVASCEPEGRTTLNG